MTAALTVTRNGTPVPGAKVAYPVHIEHGRSAVTDGPASSAAQVSFVSPSTLPDVALSDTFEVSAYGSPRFTGVVTDLSPNANADTGEARMQVNAAGRLAELALVPVASSSWPEETSDLRAARVFAAAGATAYVAAGLATVLPSDGASSSALDMLGSLATDTGAAVFDDPSGTLIFQDLLARAQSFRLDQWAQMVGTWAATVGTWAEQTTPAVADPVSIPANVIAWGPAAAQHRGHIVNRITVTYGSPAASVMLEDTTSQATHRLRAAELKTNLATLADATARATSILQRGARPRWQLGAVTILVHELDTSTRGKVLGLRCGSRVVINGLPGNAYGAATWLGVVEGWSEQYVWNDKRDREEHYITFALSDPRASFASMQWAEAPAGRTWAGIPTGHVWADLTDPANLS